MKRHLLALALLPFVALSQQTAQDPAQSTSTTTLIHAGHMIDVESGRVLGPTSITIKDGRISAMESGFRAPAVGEVVIELREQTLMPGFIDMHVHLGQQSSAASRWEWYQLNPADFAIRATVYAKRTLDAGFTSVRDLGTEHGVALSLRNQIDAGVVPGPRIFAAGKAMGSTGGHMDPTEGFNNELRGDPGAVEGVINSAEDARKAVRERYKEGADLIKLASTGGVLDSGVHGDNTQLTDEELAAVVATARDYNFAVAVHAHGREGMLRAVKAGVDSIEHGTYMDEEIMREMKKRGTYLVPTLSAGQFVAEKAKIPGYFSDVVQAKAAKIGPLLKTNLARAYKAGVKIAFGTDQGVAPHGENAKEFVYMSEAGLPPMVLIQSATIEAAKLLRQSANLGSIHVGKFADIVAVDGDPLKDVTLLMQVKFVMKNGVVYKAQEK